MGILSFFANLIIAGRLSSFFFPFFVQKILKRFRKLVLATPLPNRTDIVILQSNSWWDAILIFSFIPNLKILLPDPYLRRFPWINGWIESIYIIPPDPESRSNLEKLFRKAKKLQEQKRPVCLFFHKRTDSEQIIDAYTKVFGKFRYRIVFAHGVKERIPRRFLFFRFCQKQITFSFSKKQ